MNALVKYVIEKLEESCKPMYLDDLVISFLHDLEKMNDDSSDYDQAYRLNIRLIKKYIKDINKQTQSDGFGLVAIEYATSDRNAIKCGPNFHLVVNSSKTNYEDPNRFANRVGYEILKMFGCRTEDICITPDSNDGGIDFMGRVYKILRPLNIGYEFTVAGQIKKYSGKVTVREIREFIGAVCSTEINSCSNDISSNIPVIMVFVTTSSLTQAALETAKLHKILVISKLHLCSLGIY